MADSQSKKSQNSFLKPFGSFLRRYHLIIFFLFLAGCVAYGVFLINETLANPTSEEYTSNINAGAIDQATLDRVNVLHTSDEPSPAPAPPEGRSNPFAE